jgi:hypothetical protein
LVLRAKGSNEVSLGNGNTFRLFSAIGTSGTNYLQVSGTATGVAPVLSAQGSDTNIDLALTPKGAASVRVNQNASGANGLIISQDVGVSTNSGRLFFDSSAGTASITNFGGNTLNFRTAATIGSTSGTEQLRVAHTASAVNFMQVTGAVTGGTPFFLTAGSDANIGMVNATKGAGAFGFWTNSGANQQFSITHTASAVNRLQVTGAAAGFGPVLSAQGSDTNISAVIQPKGTGALQAQLNDGTATGGNIRGGRVVDWQTLRSTAAQVASGFAATISGGYDNTASGGATGVLSGTQNAAGAGTSVIAGGIGNTTSSSAAGNTYSGVLTGYTNNATGVFNVIVGGFTNSGTANAAVTTQSATMNGTTAVTLSGTNASIRVGQYITGTNISAFPPTYVAAISGTSLTLSQAASGSGTATLSFFTPHGVVVGGGNNQATGAYSFIGGGGDAGTASLRNAASGDWSFVGGGSQNTASGSFSSVLGGGNCSATGSFAVNLGGAGNASSGFGSTNLGGNGNIANGTYSVAGGFSSANRSIGSFAFASGSASRNGDAQAVLFVLRNATTDATPTVLTIGAGAAGTTNQVILPNNAAYHFRGSVIANVTGAANGAAWSFEGAIMRGANAASTVLIGAPVVNRIAASAGATAWTIAVTADTTNGGLAVTVTGAASTTIRWVCRVETCEVTF